MNRDQNLTALRPIIDSINISDCVSIAETFQNQVLRPILKLQSEIILLLFTNYIKKTHADFLKFSEFDRKKVITQILQKDLTLRNLLIGMVIGMMSVTELNTYYENEPELKKRTVKMLITRLIDQL